MSQRRLNIFGALIETADMPDLASNFMAPSRLVGNNFLVAAADLLQITAGSCLLPDGVLVIETEVKNISIPNSSLATDYTVLYQLEDTGTIGGSPAVLRLVDGIKRQENLTDGTIIGWVRYPGGNIPLASSFFIQPSHLRIHNNPAEFYFKSLCPLSEAIKEAKGTQSPVRTLLSDLTITSSTPVSFGGVESRVVGATVMPRTLVASDNTNYLVIEVKKGTDVLFSHSTRPTILGGEGELAVLPTSLKKSVATPDKFVIEANELATIQVTRTGIVPATQGEIVLNMESPATSGNWEETIEYVSNEACSRFANVSTIPDIYTMTLPFIIPDRQPSKLISRLLVDFNCLVTFSINVKGNIITLSPNGGLVSNTGDIITREFYVPTASSVVWEPGGTASINVTIDAQAGRGVSFAYIGLTLEPTPFTLFV